MNSLNRTHLLVLTWSSLGWMIQTIYLVGPKTPTKNIATDIQHLRPDLLDNRSG